MADVTLLPQNMGHDALLVPRPLFCGVVYVLSAPDVSLTYVGVTNNLRRRLRQHRGEIKGGAASTKRSKLWRAVFVVSRFASRGAALSFEWYMHNHRRVKRIPRPPRGTSPLSKRLFVAKEICRLYPDKFPRLEFLWL